MANKWIVINILLSLIVFMYIFYSYAGMSGGDLAILWGNIMFGLLQILSIAIICRIYKKRDLQIILAVIIIQAIELLFFLNWGYSVNEFLKK